MVLERHSDEIKNLPVLNGVMWIQKLAYFYWKEYLFFHWAYQNTQVMEDASLNTLYWPDMVKQIYRDYLEAKNVLFPWGLHC